MNELFDQFCRKASEYFEHTDAIAEKWRQHDCFSLTSAMRTAAAWMHQNCASVARELERNAIDSTELLRLVELVGREPVCDDPGDEYRPFFDATMLWPAVRIQLARASVRGDVQGVTWTAAETLKHWSSVFGTGEKTLSGQFQRGEIHAEKVGKFWRVDVRDLPADHASRRCR